MQRVARSDAGITRMGCIGHKKWYRGSQEVGTGGVGRDTGDHKRECKNTGHRRGHWR